MRLGRQPPDGALSMDWMDGVIGVLLLVLAAPFVFWTCCPFCRATIRRGPRKCPYCGTH